MVDTGAVFVVFGSWGVGDRSAVAWIAGELAVDQGLVGFEVPVVMARTQEVGVAAASVAVPPTTSRSSKASGRKTDREKHSHAKKLEERATRSWSARGWSPVKIPTVYFCFGRVPPTFRKHGADGSRRAVRRHYCSSCLCQVRKDATHQLREAKLWTG